MDLIVRGGRNIADPVALRSLQPGQKYPIWRGKRPRYIRKGDRVYFVDERGNIYLYARYAGYRNCTDYNLQGVRQSGGAILVKAPVIPITPPFSLNSIDPTIHPKRLGPWPKRYDKWNLRQHI